MEKKRDQVVYAVIIVAAVVGQIYTASMSKSAAKYPRFILYLILGLALILLIKTAILQIREKRSAASSVPDENAQEPNEKTEKRKDWIFPAKEWGVMGIAVLYVVLLKLIGFLPASLLAFVGLAVFVGYRKWLPLAVVAVCSVALTYFLFFKYLNLAYIGGTLFR